MSYTKPEMAQRNVVIRVARDADLRLLRELAALESAPPIEGPALVAVVDGRMWAAYGLENDRVVADPFVPSAQAAGLLRLRARQLRAPEPRGRGGRAWGRRATGRFSAT
jgi:hypothetical protein